MTADLSPADVADILGVSRSYVYERTQLHEWPHHRYGKRITFTAEDVDAIRELHAQPVAPISRFTRGRRRTA